MIPLRLRCYLFKPRLRNSNIMLAAEKAADRKAYFLQCIEAGGNPRVLPVPLSTP